MPDEQELVTPRPAYRSALSESTLPWSADANDQIAEKPMQPVDDGMGASACLFNTALLDHVGGMSAECKDRVMKLKDLDHQAKMDSQDVQTALQEITQGLTSKQDLSVKLEIQKRTTENAIVQIEKAKMELMSRWPPQRDEQSNPKILALNQWAVDKIDSARKPYIDLQQQVVDLDSQLDKMVTNLLGLLETPAVPTADPEHDELMRELELKFDSLVLEDTQIDETQQGGDKTDVLMVADPQTQALNAIKSLPDGPQKQALFAVLEAAATTPAESPKAYVWGNMLSS